MGAYMETAILIIIIDLIFLARFLYIKKHFYKTKGLQMAMAIDLLLSLFMDTKGIIMFAV